MIVIFARKVQRDTCLLNKPKHCRSNPFIKHHTIFNLLKSISEKRSIYKTVISQNRRSLRVYQTHTQDSSITVVPPRHTRLFT